MRSPEQLRAEVQRLLDDAKRSSSVTLRQTLAARALELAQQAEAIESLPDDVEGLGVRVAQYRYMLDRTDSGPKQRVVAQLLRDAEDKLQRVSSQQRTSRPYRVVAG